MKTLTLQDIPQDQLHVFIKKMDGYHGISIEDKSWVCNQESTPHKLTLYCYLISQGILFIEDQKLLSRIYGYVDLTSFINEFFKAKSIVSFTNLFFHEEIIICFLNW